jgi:methionine aminopeptidase
MKNRAYPITENPQRGSASERYDVAIEPMINIGTFRTKVMKDQWTVKTADGSLSAHYEHTVAITDGAPRILTAL